MGKTALILATAFALALQNVALADQKKKPPPKSENPTESVGLNYGKIEWSNKKGSSTGPTKPTLPTTSGQHR